MTGLDRRGSLIALEGIDGAGKSTVARALMRRWRRAGLSVALLREPSDPALGRAAVARAARDPWGAAMLFSLDRLLGRAPLEAALLRHDRVLLDRSFFSTLAYQADRLPARERRSVERLQPRLTRVPDRVIWLDLDPRFAVRRIARRGAPRAALERERNLRRVARAYGRLARRGRWIRVDATLPLPEVLDAVERALGRRVRSARSRDGVHQQG